MKEQYELDSFQRKAVYTELKNALIVAPPGSGKTTVIINRLNYIIDTLKICPENIAVITFTRAAAMEMENRFNNPYKRPFFGTFHSLFYKILKKENNNLNIIDENTTKKIMREVLKFFLIEVSNEKIRETINNISVFKISCIPLASFNPTIDKNAFEKCFTIYEDYKIQNNLLDFDDLQLNCMKLLQNKTEILDFYRKKLQYILIDEFQDCDEMQLKILKLLNHKNKIFAVGDEDQSIYSFRGAKPETMVEFNSYFPDSDKIYLEINYRCPFNVVELSKNLIKNNLLRNDKQIKSNNKQISDITIEEFHDEYQQAVRIESIIRKLSEENIECCKDCAVLYRTNSESKTLIDIFVKNKLPFKLMDRAYNFYDHFICRDIIAYLKLSLDFTDKDSLLRIINKPNRYAGRLLTQKLKDNKYKVDCFDFIFQNNLAPIYLLKSLNALRLDLYRIRKMDLSMSFEYILNSTGYINFIKEFSSKNNIEFSELNDILCELKESFKQFNNLKEFLLHIEKVSELNSTNVRSKENKNSVTLSTVHGVKGMEFKNVFIINCNEDNIPFDKKEKHTNLEEERRIFYVAVTRTKERLWIFSTVQFKGRKIKPSFFISEAMEGNQLSKDNGQLNYSIL